MQRCIVICYAIFNKVKQNIEKMLICVINIILFKLLKGIFWDMAEYGGQTIHIIK